MEKMEKITVDELLDRMRKMEIGATIDLLCDDYSGEEWFGIRRLPDDIFDNGKCWFADGYGGCSTQGFSEGPFNDALDLEECLVYWLNSNNLLEDFGLTVNIALGDYVE